LSWNFKIYEQCIYVEFNILLFFYRVIYDLVPVLWF